MKMNIYIHHYKYIANFILMHILLLYILKKKWHIDNQGKASKLHIRTTSIHTCLIPTKIQFWTLYQDEDNMKVFKVPNKKTKLVWKVKKVPNTRTRPICWQIDTRPKLVFDIEPFHALVGHACICNLCMCTSALSYFVIRELYLPFFIFV
jgi:hypothetical protein